MRLVRLGGRGGIGACFRVGATCGLLGLGAPAGAQPVDPPAPSDIQTELADQLKEKASHAFFHISVTGTPNGSPHTTNREGNAFAVAPNLLVTSQHVVGDVSDWQPKDGPQEITRASRPVDRNVILTRSTDSNAFDEYTHPIILPSPYALDIVPLMLPSAGIEKYFRLSLCGVNEGETYRAIMTSDKNPADRASVKQAKLVKLEAKGYDPEAYGQLYVFDPIKSGDFHGEPIGHDGSPIFDADGGVVAVISAVTAKPGSGGYLVLATPIEPMFPGVYALLAREIGREVGADRSLRCSISETVKQINDEVSAHAVWDVIDDRDDDGVLKDLHLHYDSMKEKPNIEAIEIEYDFIGKQRKNVPSSRLHYPDPPLKTGIKLTPATDRDREFALSQIVADGKLKLQKFLNDKHEGGFIDSVTIRLYQTHLVGGKISNKSVDFNVNWRKQ